MVARETELTIPLSQKGSRIITSSALVQYGLAAVTLVLVFAPLLPILAQSLIAHPLYEGISNWTFANFVDLVTAPGFLKVIRTTLIFAGLATLISTVVGLSMAILLGRTDVPGKAVFHNLFLAPILVSQLVLALGWFIVYGRAGYVTLWVQNLIGVAPWNLYSVGGIALVAGVAGAPLTFLYCLAAVTKADASLENAARTCGAGPLRTLFEITLPLLRPAILYSLVITFANALEMLAVPLVLGGPERIEVLSTLLYTEGFASVRPNYGFVSAAAVLLLAIITLLLYLQRRLLQNSNRFVTVGGKAARNQVLPLGHLRWPVFAVLFAYFVFLIFLPLGILALRASVSLLTPLIPIWGVFTFDNFVQVLTLDLTRRAILNTIFISGIGAAIGTLFVALLTVVIHRSSFPFRRPLEYMALFPRAVPGIVAGMGFLYAMILIPPMGWIRNSVWLMIVAYIMRYIPLAYGALAPSSLQISRDLDRSANIIGANWWQATRTIVLPLMAPAMFSSYVLLFIYFFKEYSVAVFLFSPGNEVIGSVLLNAWGLGDFGVVSALATLQILITLAFVVGARRLFGVGFHA